MLNKERIYKYIPGILFGFFLAAYFYVSVRAYLTNGLQNFDFGILYQAASLFAHGKPLFLSVRGVHTFADNQDYIQLFWAPLTLLPYPQIWMILFHSILMTLPGLMIMSILGSKHRIAGILLALCYWLHPAMLNMNQETIHSEAYAMPLLLAIFWSYLKKSHIWFFVFLTLAMAIKEDMPLTCFFLVLCFLFLSRKESASVKKVYAVAAVFCLAFFSFNFFVINPHFKQLTCQWQGVENFSGNPLQPVAPVAEGLFTAKNPVLYILESFLRIEFLGYLVMLLAPLLLLPRKHWFFALALIPFLSIIASTRNNYHIQMLYHYDYATVAVLIICWLTACLEHPPIRYLKTRLLIFLAFLIFLPVASLVQMRTPYHYLVASHFWQNKKNIEAEFLEKLNQLAPANISFSADYLSLNYLLDKGRDSVFMWMNPFKSSYFGIYGVCEKSPTKEVDMVVLKKEGLKISDLEVISSQIYEQIVTPENFPFYIYMHKSLNPEFKSALQAEVDSY